MLPENIFDDLYRNSETESIQGLDGLSELIYQTDPSPARQAVSGDGDSSYNLTERKASKKKVTYYLSKKVLVELCEAKARIKVLVPSNFKSKVSMSRIVDYAVDAILEEFNTIGEKSSLVEKIISDK
jgi:hypothetical protein